MAFIARTREGFDRRSVDSKGKSTIKPTSDKYKNWGLDGGARRIRNVGVARNLCEGNATQYWRNFASKSVSILQRMSSPSVGYEFRR